VPEKLSQSSSRHRRFRLAPSGPRTLRWEYWPPFSRTHRVDRPGCSRVVGRLLKRRRQLAVHKPASASISSRFIDAMAGAVKSDVDAPRAPTRLVRSGQCGTRRWRRIPRQRRCQNLALNHHQPWLCCSNPMLTCTAPGGVLCRQTSATGAKSVTTQHFVPHQPDGSRALRGRRFMPSFQSPVPSAAVHGHYCASCGPAGTVLVHAGGPDADVGR
jgi:hypothetical protein